MNTTQMQNEFIHPCFVREAKFYYIRGSVPNNYFINHIICCLVNVLLALTTTLLNSITVLTYWKSPRLRTKVSYFMIMILSLADLGVGVVGQPAVVVQLVREILGKGSCATSALADILSTIPIGMSLAVLKVMSIERYFGVIHPLFHRAKVTKQRLLIITIILWLSFLLKVWARFYIRDDIYKIVISSDIVLLVILTLIVYTKIFCVWKSSTKANVSRNAVSHDGRQANTNELRGFLQNVMQAKTFFIVVICSFVCLAPQAIVTSSLGLKGGAAVSYWSATFIMMNSSLNSLVLFWRNQHLRSEARRVVGGLLFHRQ